MALGNEEKEKLMQRIEQNKSKSKMMEEKVDCKLSESAGEDEDEWVERDIDTGEWKNEGTNNRSVKENEREMNEVNGMTIRKEIISKIRDKGEKSVDIENRGNRNECENK